MMAMPDDNRTSADTPAAAPPRVGRRIFGMNPLKVLFAMEYVLQGLANPFQGITYQSFFKHFRFDYGLSEAATQQLFSRAYLAWSFKPLIGFLMDAYGKTKVVLAFLLLSGAGFYLLTPFIDLSVMIFFWAMFALSVVFACTDVAVDRATVIAGDAESKASGRSKAAAVGLNQSICWAAIYGTSIVSAATGGLLADHVPIQILLIGLAAVPLAVLLVVLRLPRDEARPVAIRQSVSAFWDGLNTGPILWVVIFYFLFHFQPALGALWTNYLIEEIKFTQTQIGYADGVAYAGYFIGVLLFARYGIRWQDRYGLRTMFRAFILLSMAISFTQYLQVDPWFSRIAAALHAVLPGSDLGVVRWSYYATYNFCMSIVVSFIRMSTFSLVGAIIPVRAAGSLFAGFMSVSNLAFSFSYASGSWLYEHGLNYGVFRALEKHLFGIAAEPGGTMSISLLIFVGSAAYLLSLLVAHVLPDRRHTQAAGDLGDDLVGPAHYRTLGPAVLRIVNASALALGAALLAVQLLVWHRDPIASVIISFFLSALARKVVLDRLYKARARTQ
jgi:MFS family permease